MGWGSPVSVGCLQSPSEWRGWIPGEIGHEAEANTAVKSQGPPSSPSLPVHEKHGAPKTQTPKPSLCQSLPVPSPLANPSLGRAEAVPGLGEADSEPASAIPCPGSGAGASPPLLPSPAPRHRRLEQDTTGPCMCIAFVCAGDEHELLQGSVLTRKTMRGSIVPCIRGKLLLFALPFAPAAPKHAGRGGGRRRRREVSVPLGSELLLFSLSLPLNDLF